MSSYYPLSNKNRNNLCYLLSISIVAVCILSGCMTTFVTRMFEDEYWLKRYRDGEPVGLPPYMDFYGWSVSFHCTSVINSNDEVRIKSHMYFLYITRVYVIRDSADIVPNDDIEVSEISLYLLPSEERMTLQLDTATILSSNTDDLDFGRQYVSPKVDSIQVEYTVHIKNTDTGLSDSAEFSYMLYRYENKKRIPIFFTGE